MVGTIGRRCANGYAWIWTLANRSSADLAVRAKRTAHSTRYSRRHRQALRESNRSMLPDAAVHPAGIWLAIRVSAYEGLVSYPG
jgi:hypothetical protein